MKGKIKKVYAKEFKARDSRKFKKICIEVDVVGENNIVRTRTAQMSIDYAKKYFNHCGLSSADLPGMDCNVTMQKRMFKDAEGNDRVVEEIKYLNMLDDAGNPIIMRKEEPSEDLGF